MNGPLFDGEEITELLVELDRRLKRRGVTGRIYVVGGAAIALSFDTRRSTRDIDAVILDSHGALIEEVRSMARAHSLPETWLNEQASVYANTDDVDAPIVYSGSNLSVSAGSARHLLAMKARASRASDVADIRLLARHLDLSTAVEIERVASEVFGEPLGDRQKLVVEDIADTLGEPDELRG